MIIAWGQNYNEMLSIALINQCDQNFNSGVQNSFHFYIAFEASKFTSSRSSKKAGLVSYL